MDKRQSIRNLYDLSSLDKTAGALGQDLAQFGSQLLLGQAATAANYLGSVYGMAEDPEADTPMLNSKSVAGSFCPGLGGAQAARRRVMMHRHYGAKSPRHRTAVDSLGTLFRALLYGAAGAGAGAGIGASGRTHTGSDVRDGALLGGLAGAVGSAGFDLLSSLAGLMSSTRSDAEQREHEARGVGAYDWLVPGLYESGRSLRKLYSDSYHGRDTYLGGGKDGDDSGNDDKRDKED